MEQGEKEAQASGPGVRPRPARRSSQVPGGLALTKPEQDFEGEDRAGPRGEGDADRAPSVPGSILAKNERIGGECATSHQDGRPHPAAMAPIEDHCFPMCSAKNVRGSTRKA